MKLTKREKAMLALLGMIILVFLISNYIYKPQAASISALKEKLAAERLNLQRLKVEISPDNQAYKEYKILNQKIYDSTLAYFPEIKQDKFIVILDDMIKASELKVNSISFSVATDKGFEEEEVLAEADQKTILQQLMEVYFKKKPSMEEAASEDNNTGSEKTLEGEVDRISITLTFNGSYKNITDFIREIENYEKKIIIDSINIVRDKNGILNGNIKLDFFAVPKLHQQDQKFYEWRLTDIYGKENPFVAFDSYAAGGTNTGTYSSAEPADFIMTVKPITSDMPTIALGKTKDKEAKTYVYADNIGMENVELVLDEKDGKFYYKYRTNYESYPKNYEAEMVGFTPGQGSINLTINSNPRKSKDDTSGVNITIINNTTKVLQIEIEDDDKSSPRVNIVKKIGRIEIK